MKRSKGVGRTRRLLYGAGLVLLLAGLGPGLGAEPTAPGVAKEYQIKAAFLYNFTKFIDWPQETFATSNCPIVIGVYGKDPFGLDLKDLVKGRKVNGRDTVVEAVTTLEAAKRVQILFLGATKGGDEGSILQGLAKRSVLTVGESEAFATQGGMIRFVVEGARVRFDLNAAVAERAGLHISAKLQKVARSVRQ